MDRSASEASFSTRTGVSIVVANMIGTGVFTSLGFQLLDIRSAPVILLLWILGGALALCGALCYAELGAKLPRSGGEYNFLSRIYHPGVGFVAGWVSATIGFAAPTALAAMTAATYAHAVFPGLNVTAVALALVLLVGMVHLGSRRGSAGFQQAFTAIKIGLILVFVFSAWWFVDELQRVRWQLHMEDSTYLAGGAFAIALIYVNYAYTGWNAATYLAGELAEPRRSLPRILIVGTSCVMVLYVLLHVMFLSVAPMSAMAGQLEIGYVVAQHAYGAFGSQLVAAMLALLLVSTVSAMVLAGPRALQVIGQDFGALKLLARENKYGVPAVAIGVQTAITAALVVTATFDAILVFSSFTLALSTVLAVAGVVVLRRRQPHFEASFAVPWYPVPVIVYLSVMLWTLGYVLWVRPVEALVGVALIATGWLFYQLSK